MVLTTHKYTFCRICEAACGLKARLEGDEVVEIEPNAEHVVSRGYACIKGLTAHEFRDSPDRITQPLKRVDGGYKPIPWQQALTEIGAKLRDLKQQHGADSIGAYLGNPPSMSFLPPLFTQGMISGLGSSKLYHTGSQDCNNKFVVAERLYGSPQIQPFPDIARTQCLIAVGSNPAISKMSFISLPHPVQRLQDIERRGGRVVWVNPRRTETAGQVGEHVFIRPDTDVFFMLAFLHEVLARGVVPSQGLSSTMKGFDALAQFSRAWTPERAAEVTGIDASVLRQLVDAYLDADGAALYCSTGVNQGSNGTIAFWIQEAINAITGNLDRAGGTLVGKGVLDTTRQTRFDPAAAVATARIGGVPLVMDTVPAGVLADDILADGEGQLRALVMVGGNPVLTCANSARLQQAFGELELLVAIDLVHNESAANADYILPGSHWLERPDIPFVFMTAMGTMPDPVFQYSDPVLPLAGLAREEPWILLQLLDAAGANLFGSRLVQWLAKWAYGDGSDTRGSQRMLALLSRVARQGGLGALRKLVHGKLLAANEAGSFLGKRLVTPDGLLNLAPGDLLQLAPRLEASYQLALQQRQQLKLISRRERFSHNSWTHNHPSYVKGQRHTNYLTMNPEDGVARGLCDGDRVRVSSEQGSVELPLKLSDEMMIGAVTLPHGWGHQSAPQLRIASQTTGVNANILASDGAASLEPISGMSQLNGIVVEVTQAIAVEQLPAAIAPIAWPDASIVD